MTTPSAPTPSPDLTIVMPALNEEANIHAAVTNTLAAFDDLKIAGEIVVVNDGSTDGTASILADLMAQDERVSAVHHEVPHGIGASFWEGVDQAQGKYVCMLPGDNENDPWEIFRYIGLLDHVDMVIPFVFNKEARSLFRNAISFLYRFIINTTFLVNFNYTNGTVIFRLGPLRELNFRASSFFYMTDILVRLVRRGYLFAEVPYRLDIRVGDVSKAVTFPSLLRVMKGYIQLVRGTYFETNSNMQRVWSPGSQTDQRRSAAAGDPEAPPPSGR